MVKSIGAQPMGTREWVLDLRIASVERDVDVDAAAAEEDAVAVEEEVVEAAPAPQTFRRLRQRHHHIKSSKFMPCRSRLSGGSTSGRLNKPRQTATFLANTPSLQLKPLDHPLQILPYTP
jgi:hypothetical protein